jgi:HAMP domain-containing protein
MAAGLAVAGVTGCATKNYVRTQTAPLVEHTDQLDSQDSGQQPADSRRGRSGAGGD